MNYLVMVNGEKLRSTNDINVAKAIVRNVNGSYVVGLKECPMIKATCCTHEYYNNPYRNGKTYLRIA